MKMKIETDFIEEITIEEFAERHDLVMCVIERHKWIRKGARTLPRYYASFKNSDISKPGVLVGASGNGETPEEAITDYASEISEQLLVIEAATPIEKRIQVPRLVALTTKPEATHAE